MLDQQTKQLPWPAKDWAGSCLDWVVIANWCNIHLEMIISTHPRTLIRHKSWKCAIFGRSNLGFHLVNLFLKFVYLVLHFLCYKYDMQTTWPWLTAHSNLYEVRKCSNTHQLWEGHNANHSHLLGNRTRRKNGMYKYRLGAHINLTVTYVCY